MKMCLRKSKKPKRPTSIEAYLTRQQIDRDREYELRIRLVLAVERMVKLMELAAAREAEPRLR